MRDAHTKRMRDGVQFVIRILIPVDIESHEPGFAVAKLLQADAARLGFVKPSQVRSQVAADSESVLTPIFFVGARQ